MIELTVKKTFTENHRNANKCYDALRDIKGACQPDDILIGCSESTCIVVHFKGDECRLLNQIQAALLQYKDAPKISRIAEYQDKYNQIVNDADAALGKLNAEIKRVEGKGKNKGKR